MKVRELINHLLDFDMDSEVVLFLNEPHIDEFDSKVLGYCFNINKFNKFAGNVELEFTDWRKEKAIKEDKKNGSK